MGKNEKKKNRKKTLYTSVTLYIEKRK